jgi:hypothetical protein
MQFDLQRHGRRSAAYFIRLEITNANHGRMNDSNYLDLFVGDAVEDQVLLITQPAHAWANFAAVLA